jgi:PAS domain S-box-containing protein
MGGQTRGQATGSADVDVATAASSLDAFTDLAQRLAAEPQQAFQHVVDAARRAFGADAVALALGMSLGDAGMYWRALAGPAGAAPGIVPGDTVPDAVRAATAPTPVAFAGTHALAVPVACGDSRVGALFLIYARGVPESLDASRVAALAACAALAVRLDAPGPGILAALRDSEQRFAMFMQQLPGLAWMKDLDGRYVFVNDAAERAFGRPRSELYGRTDEEIFPAETAAQFRANDRKVLATGVGVQTIETLEQHDGVHHSLVHKFAVPSGDGTAQYIGGVAIDISDRIRVEQALREADHHKDQFLATLAHELRNPLAPIRSGVQALALAGAGDARTRQIHEIMERQVEHLVRLMEVSRITRGKVELRRAPVDVADVVRNAVDASRPVIDAARHRFTVDLFDTGLVVDGDAMRLAQVLVNLLNNAAKFTEPGGHVALRVRAVGGWAEISVRDDGVGIPREMLPRVFDLFTQVSRGAGRLPGGLGIGLALVKRLVEMHGGAVEASSAGVGQGSEFRVRLPLVDARAVAAPAAGAPPRALPLPRRRVLVVDDNRDAALCLQNLVQLLGMDAHAAFDGPSALQEAAVLRPAFVLLDLDMPGMSGYEVAARLRELPGGDDVVLVAVTGLGQPEDRQRTQAAGFAHHLVKPADLRSLQAVLGDAARVATA